MGIGHFAAIAKMPTRTNGKLPKETRAVLSSGTSAKLLLDLAAQMPSQRTSAAERLQRLDEAKAFLRLHLAAGPQPARALLKAARAAGIATRTLHRAIDALGGRPERSGGYGAHGQWTWYPHEAGGPAAAPSVPLQDLAGVGG